MFFTNMIVEETDQIFCKNHYCTRNLTYKVREKFLFQIIFQYGTKYQNKLLALYERISIRSFRFHPSPKQIQPRAKYLKNIFRYNQRARQTTHPEMFSTFHSIYQIHDHDSIQRMKSRRIRQTT